MDYKSLLSLAERNQEMKDSANEFLLRKRAKDLSSGPNKAAVDAFKARKQKEEMEKQKEDQRKKERLMSLRAQNSKNVRKAKMMKTRTKDNDFSRILLTDQQIEEQRRVEEKLKLKGTQDLIQNKRSLNDMEDKMVHKSTHNSIRQQPNTSRDNAIKTKDNDKTAESKPKSKPKPPAMSYDQLLSLATEKAKSEKISLTEDIMTHIEEPAKKQMRPMTQREKDRLKEEMFYKQRAHKGLARLPDPQRIQKQKQQMSRDSRAGVTSKKSITYEKSLNNSNNSYVNNKMVSKTASNANQTQTKCDKDFKKPIVYNNNNKNNNNVNINRNNSYSNESVIKSSDRQQPIARSGYDSRRMGGQSSSSASNKSEILKKMSNRLNTRDKEYNDKVSKATEAERLKANTYNKTVNNRIFNDRARPPSPPPPRQPPPSFLRRQLPKLPPIGSNYKREMYEDVAEYMDDYEEEEDDDDDMADFIDDGPAEPEENEYSSAIREIFGYDKRKYRNVDDDDIEESSFTQIMKEDVRSSRIGLMEDLEDIKQEEEERRQHMLAKKRRLNQQKR